MVLSSLESLGVKSTRSLRPPDWSALDSREGSDWNQKSQPALPSLRPIPAAKLPKSTALLVACAIGFVILGILYALLYLSR